MFDKNFKRGAGKPLFLSLLISLIGTYIITVVLFKFGHGGNLNSLLLQPGRILDFAIHEKSLGQVLLLLPILLFCGCVYLFRESILKKSIKDASEFGLHGTSRWGKFSEVITGSILSNNNKYSKKPLSALDVDPGIVIAKVPDKNELLIIPENTSIDNRNILVIGSSGSGKGQSFVFPNVINQRNETIIITDPKGEIYEATHQLKRDQGYKVYTLDFVDFNPASGYNPLDYVKDDEDARTVANTIASNAVDDAKRDFWSESAIAYLAAIILYTKVEMGDQATMRDIVTFTAKAGKEESYIDEILEGMDHDHPAYDMFSLANMSAGNTRSGIMSTLAQQLGIFALRKISKFTAKSGFNFRDLQKEKSVLYIKVRMKTNPFKQLTATFFEQLIDELYEIADENHSHLLIKTIFLLDEFANIGKINSYPSVLSTCRGLGLSLNTIIQDLGQIESKRLYGPEDARTIISNHDTTLYLRSKDTKTAEYFSKLAGETTVSHKQKSTSVGQKNSSKSFSEQHVKRPLITVGELTNIPSEVCYVFISGQFPLKAEKAFQYNVYGDFLFKNRKPSYSNYSRDSFLQKYNVPAVPIYEADSSFTAHNPTEIGNHIAEQAEDQDIAREMAMQMDALEREVASTLNKNDKELVTKDDGEGDIQEISGDELNFLLNSSGENNMTEINLTKNDESGEITDEELAMLLTPQPSNEGNENVAISNEEEKTPDQQEVDAIDSYFSELEAEYAEIEQAIDDVSDTPDLIEAAAAELLQEAEDTSSEDQTENTNKVLASANTDDDLPM